MNFRATIRYWRPESQSGLAVADIPSQHIRPLGGLKQLRVRGRINRAEYVSSVMPAGSGRLALSVSQKMRGAAPASGWETRWSSRSSVSHPRKMRAEHLQAKHGVDQLD